MKSTFLSVLLGGLAITTMASAQTNLTIATVNNAEMIVMQELSHEFEAQNPDIKLNWVTLEENTLRQKVTTDISTKGGQFDIMTVGAYETALWGKNGWLLPLDDLPNNYDIDDLIPSVRNILSADGHLYASPFYAESSMTYYNKALFEKAGIQMAEKPTFEDITNYAKAISALNSDAYGICLRGKAGWGENMGSITTTVHNFGGQYFDEDWNVTIDTPEWHNAISWYHDVLTKYGPPGASSNGYNENRALFASGKCGMWIDATVAAGYFKDPKESQVADVVGFAPAPVDINPKGAGWLWSWALGIPSSSQKVEDAKKFISWATSKDYIRLVGEKKGWLTIPPGTRKSTYEIKDYMDKAEFAPQVYASLMAANPTDNTLKPSPYVGIQFVQIPEFQSFGTEIGQIMSALIAGDIDVDTAIKRSQQTTERIIKRTRK
ncbi:MAG: ABC transporter substrate-binding protein [Alphaproteobacteria bacterium]